MNLVASVMNRAYGLFASPSHRRFAAALRSPREAQASVLRRILSSNANSDFGRRHGFDTIRNAAEFRARVPMGAFEAFAPHVDRIAAGARGVLTAERVAFFEPTSGSTGVSKLIPYTPAFLKEYARATVPWIGDLLAHRPALRGGRSYWAITPPGRSVTRTAGGIPVGLESDSDYFPAFVRALLDRVQAVPKALSGSPSVDACRYLTLRALIAAPDLTMISVWSPSFLTLIASELDRHFERLLADLDSGDLSVALPMDFGALMRRALPPRPSLATSLRRQFGARPPDDLGLLWRRLALISCWTDGHAQRMLEPMQRRFPRVEVQGKGLLATEGAVSIPWFAAGGAVAAVMSHYLEFVDGGDACGVEDVQEGREYEVLLTTSGGLYRYRLMDRVRVVAVHHATPILRFLDRVDCTVDLAGEKLNPGFVETALQDACRRAGTSAPFMMLAPTLGEPPRYCLYVECDSGAAMRLAAELELQLLQSYHYQVCRSLGQLGGVSAIPVTDGVRVFERECVRRGQRAGAVKPSVLDAHPGWHAAFGVLGEAAVA